MSTAVLTMDRETRWPFDVDGEKGVAPKWSLIGDHARAVYGVKMGHPTLSTVGALRFATVYADEFRPADTFARFVEINGIEIMDEGV